LAVAEIQAYLGRTDEARENYAQAAQLLEEYIRDNPEAGNPHAALGRAYAGLGRRDEAIREGLRALDMFPANRDAWIRQERVFELIVIYARLGELDAAMGRLEELLSQPTSATTVHVLSHEFLLAPLR
ncbi:MAG: tetratricopeptide repeat protein, partial [Gammaproteobacteria bacterium]|nr:tetratricopeptide repeat protein [Gammaproteobacteria bacterium]